MTREELEKIKWLPLDAKKLRKEAENVKMALGMLEKAKVVSQKCLKSVVNI